MKEFILFSIFAYFLGSIPFAFLIGKLKGVDIREIGSKSTTSTNVARALGWRWGVVSALLDFSKGILPIFLAKKYLFNPWQIIIVGLLPVAGHVLPVWLNFRGGKGVATFYAATLGLIGPKNFFSLFPIWILILVISRIISLTNLLFSWLLVIWSFFFLPRPYFVFTLSAAIFLIFAFRENIKRLKEGKEPKTPFKW